jgi:hypothetical protein
MLRSRLVGLVVVNFSQQDTSYLDDVQLLTGVQQDLVTFDRVMVRFEMQSGALLSRDKKSKVMGLGQWQGREDWPEAVCWLRTVKEMKVLGFMICPQYADTLQQTWNQVFRGFQRTLFSWGSRALSTLQQRVNVLQVYALSKIWYVAQVLPLPLSMLKKIESAASSFIFRGRHERLKLAEIENSKTRGGLGLICVATKAECLLLCQTLRILGREEENCRRHISHWLGYQLHETFPDLMNLSPVCQAQLPRFPLHRAMLEALQEGLIREEYDPAALELVTSKIIYNSRAEDVIPPPKIEGKYPNVNFPVLVYPRLNHGILEAEPRDVLYSMIHNLHPTKQRLFKQNRVQDPFCHLPQCQGRVQDLEHLFTSCYLVSQAWLWLRSKLLQFLPTTVGAQGTSSEDFLLLKYPKDKMDKEIVWMIGNFCDIVLKITIVKKRKLSADQAANLMRSRLQSLKNRAVIQPEIYNL